MRLIDADKLKKVIHCAYSDDLEILEKIDEQPTVFDVDKVVERLENTKGIYSKLSFMSRDNNKIEKYIGMEQAIALALEIMKGGRSRWRDKHLTKLSNTSKK